jgi:hypothetical protein
MKSHAKRLSAGEEYVITCAPGWPLISLPACGHVPQRERQDSGCLACITAVSARARAGRVPRKPRFFFTGSASVDGRRIPEFRSPYWQRAKATVPRG